MLFTWKSHNKLRPNPCTLVNFGIYEWRENNAVQNKKKEKKKQYLFK